MPLHDEALIQRLSIVVPVYRGKRTLAQLLGEIAPLVESQVSPRGRRFHVVELLPVHDCGPDRSDIAIEAMARQCEFARPVWLSSNFGQHAATLAGMASATGAWGSRILPMRERCWTLCSTSRCSGSTPSL